MNTTITGRGAALVAGALALGGALAILLQDALTGSRPWQLEHGLIPVLMAVQILVAHLVVCAWRSAKYLAAAGFAVVAVLATGAVLYTSTGKQSSVAAEALARTDDVRQRRADLEQKLTLNDDMLRGARESLATECASGKGKRCDGIRATIAVYEDAVHGVEAQLATLPVVALTTRADATADLLAAVANADRDRVRQALLLAEPFLYATVFELAALIAFGFAFGSPRSAPPAVAITEMAEGQLTDPEIDELRRILRGRGGLTNQDVADALGVSKAEASKRVSAAVAAGVVARKREGRHVSIRLH